MVRLQKFLADAGVASRRAGEVLIRDGRVTVNRQTVTRLGSRVDPDHDVVAVEGRVVRARRKLYVALHKPPGVICSRQDERGRRTVMSLLPDEWSGLYPVGRLDRESEGLLLLTNDGDFCLRVTHPRYEVVKRYLATVVGQVEAESLSALTRGVMHQGEKLRARRLRVLEAKNTHSHVELELTEGKNREVRRLFEVVGLRVTRLRRLQVGPVRLGELPPGKWRVLTAREVGALTASGRKAPQE
jgi:23S rRNA pseudouridine2605 synthase